MADKALGQKPGTLGFQILFTSPARNKVGLNTFQEMSMFQRFEVTRQPWHNRHGFIHRLREAYWILTKKHSLHRAWQAGFDDGHRSEYHRLITNKAYIAETKHDRTAA